MFYEMASKATLSALPQREFSNQIFCEYHTTKLEISKQKILKLIKINVGDCQFSIQDLLDACSVALPGFFRDIYLGVYLNLRGIFGNLRPGRRTLAIWARKSSTTRAKLS